MSNVGDLHPGNGCLAESASSGSAGSSNGLAGYGGLREVSETRVSLAFPGFSSPGFSSFSGCSGFFCPGSFGSMSGRFFADRAPIHQRDWVHSDYTFYDTMAPRLHDHGVLCELDSREPWFVGETHSRDGCFERTVSAFEKIADETLDALDGSTKPAQAMVWRRSQREQIRRDRDRCRT